MNRGLSDLQGGTASLPSTFHHGSALSVADVEERLVEAMGFQGRLPGDARRRLTASDGPWGSIMRASFGEDDLAAVLEEMAARTEAGLRGGALTSVEVDRMEEALGWIEAFVPADGSKPRRRLVALVAGYKARESGQVDWAWVATRARWARSRDGLRVAYARSLAMIAKGLNGRAQPRARAEAVG